MAKKIKITYFGGGTGKAEPIRWMLHYAGAEFEDFRFPVEDWPKIKPSTVTGQVPEMNYDGFVLCQSVAIGRFLAKEFNLYGKTRQEEAWADMVVDCYQDFMVELIEKTVRQFDPELQKKAVKKFKEDTCPTFFKLMVKLLERNGGKFFVGDGLTFADIFICCHLDVLEWMAPDIAKTFPQLLVAYKNGITSVPQIKAWIDRRPKYVFPKPELFKD